ncbi:MFS transporter [Massilia sp. W12]|uniref:MFS transporter n=1 Tax=Massilia sp. W12 TaxID=3126507 RepID=UPI0030CE0F65
MRQLYIRLVLLVAALLALLAMLLAWLALKNFERDLPPEMARTVMAVSQSTSGVLEKAWRNGVPLDEMVGAEEYFASVLAEHKDIDYIVLTDLKQRVLYSHGLPQQMDAGLQQALHENVTQEQTVRAGEYYVSATPLVFRQQRVGILHLGQKVGLVEQKLKDVLYDVLTVLLVASLIAMELLRFVLAFSVATPGRLMREFLQQVKQGDFSRYLPHDKPGGLGQLNSHYNRVIEELNRRYHALQDKSHAFLSGLRFHQPGERISLGTAAVDHIRWPFFLLIFADSLSLSFFPVFVGQFYSADMGLPHSLVVGLPISIFMFTWALSMPWAGSWSDHVGHRKAFIVGAIVTTLGLIATAFAQTLYDLLLWRSLTAVGYGLVFITAQSYVSENTAPNQRTKAMAMFLSTFFAGSLSGSAIGGILADRLGYDKTILLSALLSAASAWFVLRFLRSKQNSTAARKKISLQDMRRLLQHKQFFVITFLAAVPAKIALTGFLYYAVPLYLKLLGSNQSTIGRVMMAYGLAIILFSPLVAKLADKLGKLRWFVSIGGFAASLSMFIIWYFDNLAGLLVSITLLGLAHAIGVSPQFALINDFCKDVVQEVGPGAANGIFRLMERIGNVTGPLIAGVLIAQFDFSGAFLGIGVLCLSCVSVFTLLFFHFERKRLQTAQAIT